MRKIHLTGVAALLLAAGAYAGPVETARTVLDQHKDAIVNITGVLKVEISGLPMGTQSEEKDIEAVGTVVDSTGLTITAASAINPMSMVGEIEVNIGGTPQKISPKGTTSGIKLRLADGTEIPARVVLTDSDLDLAFLMPEEPVSGLAFIPVAGGVSAEALDEVVCLGTMGKLLNFQPAIGLNRIVAKQAKPRTVYVLTPVFMGGPGTPVFLADGRVLGMIAVRKQPAQDKGDRIAAGGAPVVVSAADVADAIGQAKKAAAKKAEAAETPAEEKPATPAPAATPE